jgi:hypothetical protein
MSSLNKSNFFSALVLVKDFKGFCSTTTSLFLKTTFSVQDPVKINSGNTSRILSKKSRLGLFLPESSETS